MIAIPIILQMLIQTLVSLIDNFMVAGLGDIKMSGVNVANQIFFLFTIFSNTLCQSGGIFMSQFKGACDKEGMQQTFRFKILILGIFGLLFTLLCFAAPRNLFAVMVKSNADADAILDQAVIYSRAVALSWFFAVFSQSISSSLREIESVKAPLIISTIATGINTFFNFMFIYGNLGAPRLEVAGAAYATVIARACELLIFIIYAGRKKYDFLFEPLKLFKINFALFGKIFKKSAMILYSELFWAFAETFSNALFNRRGGAEVVSGMSAGFAVANLFFICFSGIVSASGVIMGQELGKGNLEQARKYKNWIISGSTIFGFIFTLLGLLTVFLIPLVFKNLSPQAQIIARNLVITAALYLPLWAYLNAQYSISRSGGDTTMGLICDTVANILFIGGMIALFYLTNLGPVAMYAIVKLSDFAKCTIAHFWLKKEKWLVNLAVENKA